MTPTRLRKSSRERVLFGVAGGLAEYFDVDPVLVRVAFVLFAFASGLGILLYIALTLIMPRAETEAATPADVMRENLQSMPGEAAEAGRRVGDALRGTAAADDGDISPPSPSIQNRRRNAFGVVIIAIGVLILLANFGVFWWLDWGTFLALVLIVIGVAIIAGRLRSG